MLGTNEVRFLKVEFCLITGLRFRVVPDTSRYVNEDNGLHHRYFGGKDEISSVDLRDVLRLGEFQQAYDCVKLCLIYMLNWILIRLDERLKISVWQIQLVDDLDAFDAFPWGAHVYSHSIYSFKHALDGGRERFQRRQQANVAHKHMQETYNIYGLSYAILMSVMTNLVPTSMERDEPYFIEFTVDIPDRDSVGCTSVVPSDTDGSEAEFCDGRPQMHTEGS
ncbi:hypothetical protein Ddye_005031 [Dipteronia dyeriana]|uniref:DUF1985 domain-containing protein n=1 Tax=Dipteronia dyeriana TaxID=168575 RepID=A0AAE0CPV2_9ROSI|nr:hypothetical protein Ddye_005031 [Dipteronia dyeriana]